MVRIVHLIIMLAPGNGAGNKTDRISGRTEMKHRIHMTDIRRGNLKLTVFLLVLLTSVNVLASPSVTAVDEPALNVQNVDPYEAIKMRKSDNSNLNDVTASQQTVAYRSSGTAKPRDPDRAYKDDYGYLPADVKNWKPKGAVWIRK